VPVGLDQAGPHQLLDVMRDSGLGDGEVPAEPRAGILLGARDRLEQGKPPGIGQGFGDPVELTLGEEAGGLGHSSIYIKLQYDGQGGRPNPGPYAKCVVFPPSTVRSTGMSFMRPGSSVCGSRGRITKSASIPGTIAP